MELTDILTLAGAFGGIQGIIEGAKWWLSRKATVRQDNAEADAKEDENDRRNTDWLEKRLQERDAKIDGIYAELRQEQTARLEEIHRRHEVELQLKEAEVKKCCKRGCADREPPSDY